MSTVYSHCPACGDVETAPKLVVVTFMAGPAGRGWWAYRVPCPKCGTVKSAPCDPRTARLLVSAGCPCTVLARPAEADEAHRGPPVDVDELLDFRHDLNGAEFEAAVARLTR